MLRLNVLGQDCPQSGGGGGQNLALKAFLIISNLKHVVGVHVGGRGLERGKGPCKR